MKLTTSKLRSRQVGRISSIAPLISLALILVFPWVFARADIDIEELQSRHVKVKEAINAVPDKLGRWIKNKDVIIPTGALAILNPNAHMSRIYQRIGQGQSIFATIMVIHCSDVRDMSNHYPPVCYVRSGWTLLNDETKDWALKYSNKRQINGRTYSFRRLEENGLDRVITVADTFLLPGGISTREMSDLEQVASKYKNSVQGVAQIQIYFDGDFRGEEGMTILNEMISEIISSLPNNLMDVLDGQANDIALIKKDPRND